MLNNFLNHQASGLYNMELNKQKESKFFPVKVVAVSGGKGGVGKTNISINLAIAAAMTGKKVMLLDGDLGLANVDVMLGLMPKYNLSHVLEGKCTLKDTILTGPSGIMVVPAASGKKNMAELTPSENVGIIRAFSDLDIPLDLLVVDTAAGISDSVVSFCNASNEVLIVVCSDPSSMTDSYALMKVLRKDYGVRKFQILANMVRNNKEAEEIFDNLKKVAEKFLDVSVNLIGSIPYDDWLKRAVCKQRAVVESYPNSPSGSAILNLEKNISKLAIPEGNKGNIEFFIERLLNSKVSEKVP